MGGDAMSSVNWLAVIVSALAGFAIGGIWYGPLFGKSWMQEVGMTEEKMQSANKAKIYGGALLLNLIAAFSLAMFIGKGDMNFGLFAGFMTGFTFVSMALGVTYLFEHRSLKLWLINAGYQTVIFTVMGVILGAWH
jgi:fluoride ion exporter CrcB/FEX